MDSRLVLFTLGFLYLSSNSVFSSNSPYSSDTKDANALRLFKQSCPADCICSDTISCGLRVDCSDMNRQDVPTGLSPLTECLDLSLNNISSIDVKSLEGLRQLKTLLLSGNSLKELPQNVFSGLKKLEFLHLQDNRLTSIPPNTVNRLPKLKNLNLGANYISSISSNAFAKLENLEHLWLDDNKLTEIPVRAFKKAPAIKALNMGMNQITSIRNGDLDDLPMLKVLLLKHNLIARIDNHAFERLENIQIVDLSYNSLVTLPHAIKGALKLHTLNLSNNRITSIPDLAFAGIPQLSELFLTGNPIKHVERTAFTGLKSLIELSLENVEELTEFPDMSGCKQLTSLVLSGGKLREIPGEFCGNVPNLRKINLRQNCLATITGLQGCTNLTELDVSHNEITEVTAHEMKNLTKIRSLNLGGNKINRLDEGVFSTMKHIEKLNLAKNSFTFLPMKGLGSLRELNVSGVQTMLYLPPIDLFHNLRSLAAYYPYHCCQVANIRSEPAESAFVQRSNSFMASLDTAGNVPMTSPVQCSPTAGPMTPCDSLLPSTPIRVFWWTAVILSFLLNGIILLSCAIRCCTKRSTRRPTPALSDEEMLRRMDSESHFSSENRVIVHESDASSSHYCLNTSQRGDMSFDNESFHASLCHLALADIFVTVYTAIVLSYDHTTRGNFAVRGAWWQQSPLCHSAGFFLTFGTQLAFGTISVMAIERYLAIINPLRTEKHMRKNMLVMALASVWAISIATGIVTLFGETEQNDDDSLLTTLPAKQGATCLAWTTDFPYIVIIVGVHVVVCLVTSVACVLMFCRKTKQSWLITKRSSRTQVTLTVAMNMIFILPLALLAVLVSGYMTFSDLTPAHEGKYSAAEDGHVVFDMGSILSFAMFAIPFRPLLNPILFLIFNKPLRKDITLVVKHALFMNSNANRTFHQRHSSMLEPMFDSSINNAVQSPANFPGLSRLYNTEQMMRPTLAYDNRGIVSSSSVSYHAPSIGLTASSHGPSGVHGAHSERKRRKRYTRSQRAERLATDTDPTTESEVITFHRGGQAVYYNPDTRERWRKKLSVRYGGINARDEFQSLVFPREHQSSSSDHGTDSTIYPVVPSTKSALKHPSINESSKNLSCDADASDVSSVECSPARYRYQMEPSTVTMKYGFCEEPTTIVPSSEPQVEFSADSDACDADRGIALITSFMMTDCKEDTPKFKDSDTVKKLHCDQSQCTISCVRSLGDEIRPLVPPGVEVRVEKHREFQQSSSFLRQSSQLSTSTGDTHSIEKLENSCEYCDSSTSKDSGIHSEIDSTSGASYSDTSMGRRLHYSTSNTGVKSLADNVLHYDVSSYNHDIEVISSMDSANTTIKLSSINNNETAIPTDASMNTLTKSV